MKKLTENDYRTIYGIESIDDFNNNIDNMIKSKERVSVRLYGDELLLSCLVISGVRYNNDKGVRISYYASESLDGYCIETQVNGFTVSFVECNRVEFYVNKEGK